MLAKLQRKPSSRQINRKTATSGKKKVRTPTAKFNQRMSIDLVEASLPDVHNNMYLQVMIDDFSRWAITIAVKDKSPVLTLRALKEAARQCGGLADEYRTDNGGEWMAEFDDYLLENLKPVTRGMPYRPTTDSLHERFHGTLNSAVRAALVQRNLPYCFWSCAAAHFCYDFNRAIKSSKGDTPYKLRFGEEYVNF